jgi:nucleotide-binding universal stress UspA family protein
MAAWSSVHRLAALMYINGITASGRAFSLTQIKAGLLAVPMLRSSTGGNAEHGEFNMYRHILIPTDGSELSQKAVEHGLAMARATNANVTVLTVSAPFHMFAFEPGMVTDTRDQYEQHVAANAAKYLAEAKQSASTAGISCETVHLENEHPYQAIIANAAQKGCDLIVMASHGRRGISAVVLGSETVKVLTHSAVPVLVVRPATSAVSLSQPNSSGRVAA